MSQTNPNHFNPQVRDDWYALPTVVHPEHKLMLAFLDRVVRDLLNRTHDDIQHTRSALTWWFTSDLKQDIAFTKNFIIEELRLTHRIVHRLNDIVKEASRYADQFKAERHGAGHC